MNQRILRTCLLVALTLLPIIGIAAQDDTETSPTGKIAFVSDRDGDREIYVMDADGGNQQRLTDRVGRDDGPTWSPDGTQITFHSERDGDFEIYIMDADGSNVQRVTDNKSNDMYPAWSPDGKQIAFVSNRGGRAGYYVVDLATGTERQIYQNPNNSNASRPTWSPDGSQIAVETTYSESGRVLIIDPGGEIDDKVLLEDMPALLPAWSPDGSVVAFMTPSANEIHSEALTLMDMESGALQTLTESDQRLLYNRGQEDYHLTWSPDGHYIAYPIFTGDVAVITVVDIESGEIYQLTDETANNYNPAWSPAIDDAADSGK